jgi:hypothetical protein
VAFAIAVIVIVASPIVLAAPNPLSTPSAIVAATGFVGALAGGRWGRRVAVLVGLAGLALSGLWFVFALNGFGKGTPWWDDVVEAGILTVAFLAALGALSRVHPSDVGHEVAD